MGGEWSRSWDGEAREAGGDPRAGESAAARASSPSSHTTVRPRDSRVSEQEGVKT